MQSCFEIWRILNNAICEDLREMKKSDVRLPLTAWRVQDAGCRWLSSRPIQVFSGPVCTWTVLLKTRSSNSLWVHTRENGTSEKRPVSSKEHIANELRKKTGYCSTYTPYPKFSCWQPEQAASSFRSDDGTKFCLLVMKPLIVGGSESIDMLTDLNLWQTG